MILQAILELRALVNVDSGGDIFLVPHGGMFLDLYRKHPSQLLPADYVEFVRWNLKRYISHKYTRGQNTLIVYLMAQDAETLLAVPAQLDAGTEAAILQASQGRGRSLPPTAQSQSDYGQHGQAQATTPGVD